MKFYLSSYKIGNDLEALKRLIPAGNKKTAYISNALDFTTDKARRQLSERSDIDSLLALGLEVEPIDLKDYFGKAEELKAKLREYGVIWVRGGNVFVLRQAMEASGFGAALKSLLDKPDILYGGYSAGICVLAPSLKGMEFIDDPNPKPYDGYPETVWTGLGILDYAIVPHFESPHQESAAAKEAAEYLADNKIPYKTLRDGEAIIIDQI